MSGQHAYRLVPDRPVLPVVVAPEELDIASRDCFHAQLLAAERSQPTVIVDMSHTVFCDSSGVQALVRAHNLSAAEGGELRLAGVTRQVSRTLALTGTDRLFAMFATVEQARASSGRSRSQP